MGRKPLARQKIMEASRQIVMERGAGCLTYDEIAVVSGVTRGGITYHFPAKQKLLKALVDEDLAQWTASLPACSALQHWIHRSSIRFANTSRSVWQTSTGPMR